MSKSEPMRAEITFSLGTSLMSEIYIGNNFCSFVRVLVLIFEPLVIVLELTTEAVPGLLGWAGYYWVAVFNLAWLGLEVFYKDPAVVGLVEAG